MGSTCSTVQPPMAWGGRLVVIVQFASTPDQFTAAAKARLSRQLGLHRTAAWSCRRPPGQERLVELRAEVPADSPAELTALAAAMDQVRPSRVSAAVGAPCVGLRHRELEPEPDWSIEQRLSSDLCRVSSGYTDEEEDAAEAVNEEEGDEDGGKRRCRVSSAEAEAVNEEEDDEDGGKRRCRVSSAEAEAANEEEDDEDEDEDIFLITPEQATTGLGARVPTRDADRKQRSKSKKKPAPAKAEAVNDEEDDEDEDGFIITPEQVTTGLGARVPTRDADRKKRSKSKKKPAPAKAEAVNDEEDDEDEDGFIIAPEQATTGLGARVPTRAADRKKLSKSKKYFPATPMGRQMDPPAEESWEALSSEDKWIRRCKAMSWKDINACTHILNHKEIEESEASKSRNSSRQAPALDDQDDDDDDDEDIILEIPEQIPGGLGQSASKGGKGKGSASKGSWGSKGEGKGVPKAGKSCSAGASAEMGRLRNEARELNSQCRESATATRSLQSSEDEEDDDEDLFMISEEDPISALGSSKQVPCSEDSVREEANQLVLQDLNQPVSLASENLFIVSPDTARVLKPLRLLAFGGDANSAFIERLSEALAGRGCVLEHSPEDQPWREVCSGIQQADVCVPILDDQFVSSEACADKLFMIKDIRPHAKPIIPLLQSWSVELGFTVPPLLDMVLSKANRIPAGGATVRWRWR